MHSWIIMVPNWLLVHLVSDVVYMFGWLVCEVEILLVLCDIN